MEIISYKDAPVGAKYLAEVEVYYKRIFYRRIRVTISQKGQYFLNLPAYSEDDGKGGKKWIQFWEWPKDEDTDFKRECLEALQAYINKQSGPNAAASMQQPAQQPTQKSYPGTYQPNLEDCPF